MRLNKLSWLPFTCLSLASSAFILSAAETPPAPPRPPARNLALEECIRMVLDQNLDIQIQRYNPITMGYNLSGSYGYYDPTFTATAGRSYAEAKGDYYPTIGYVLGSKSTTDELRASFEGILPTGLRYSLDGSPLLQHQRGTGAEQTSGSLSVPFEKYRADVGFSLTQPLLRNFWTDAGRTTIKVNKKLLKDAQLAFENTVRLKILEVQLAYYELVFARDFVSVQAKALELATNLVAQNKEKVRVGVLAPLDEKQAEAQAAASLADLLAARRLVVVRQNDLKSLITDRYEEWHAVSIIPTDQLLAVSQVYDKVDSWTTALNQRPDFKQFQVQLEIRGLRVKLDFNQLFPSLDLGGSYGRSGTDSYRQAIPGFSPAYDPTPEVAMEEIGDGLYPKHSFSAVLSFPLSMRAERNAYKASKTAVKQAELELRQKHQQILVEVDSAAEQAQSNFDRVAATHEARLYAEAALDAEQKKLENGKSTSFEVLRLQRDLTAAASTEIRALADYNVALARLHAAEGTSLQRNRITLEFK